ncbi:MAG: ATP-binding protein [Oscillospiraceae bacterium]|nr:ATP-binding protein [Oscillospiraceae bacterium]
MPYPKQVHDNARSELDRRREDARGRAVSRREEVLRLIPAIVEIERKMAETGAAAIKAAAVSPELAAREIERLSHKSLELQRRRALLLTEAGYPADYLEEQYSCAQCRDSGYIGAEKCACLKGLLRAEAHSWLGTSAPVGTHTFGSFSLGFYPTEPQDGVSPRERMTELAQFCREYADGFAFGAQSLLFLGRTGLGKTHLSLAVAHCVTEAGYGVVYTTAQQLMDRLEAERFSRGQEGGYRENLDIALGCDLLILDDLGTEFATGFTASAMYNIVNTRLVERRPVIISTNLDLSEIEQKYGQRMASRLLFEYKVLKFYGKDIRYLKRTSGMF